MLRARCTRPLRYHLLFADSLIIYRRGINQGFKKSRVFSSEAPGPSGRFEADAFAARTSTFETAKLNPSPRIEPRQDAITISQFNSKYQHTVSTSAAGTTLSKDLTTLRGRVRSSRFSGSKLAFFDVIQDLQKTQIVVNLSQLTGTSTGVHDFRSRTRLIKVGDVIEATGYACLSSSGELSLTASVLPTILAPCCHVLPYSLTDGQTRIHNRHVDFLVTPRLAHVIRLRSQIVQSLRNFLLADGQIEVSTPMLADTAGGAVARAFTTSASEFPDRRLELRIAPELWLKRMIIGGFDRIFEIGQSFRNEGIDASHNPEFTTCEFYRAYTNIDELMTLTEDLIKSLSSMVATYAESANYQITPLEIDTTRRFQTIDFVTGIEERLGRSLPDLQTSESEEDLRRLLRAKNILHPKQATLPQLLDRLCGAVLEEECNAPTFIINHPECMSPLAKSFVHPLNGQRVAARAELFIQGKEIANMYEEENSPAEQRRKFLQQQLFRDPDASLVADEKFIKALEWGLPPTGGWGCGIDRLCMILTGTVRIADVLSFGSLRHVTSQPDQT